MKAKSCFTCVVFLLFLSTNLTAQEWHWTRDDLVLNPSGLDLSNAASWAWGDLDQDGHLDILVRTDLYAGDGRLRAYRGQASSEPPYWVQAPELLAGFAEPENSAGVALADLDGDGLLNIITRVRQDPGSEYWRFLCWKKEPLETWSPDATVFQNVQFDDRLRDHDDPFFADVDGDGDLDMLVGLAPPFRSVGVRFFENRGTAHHPMWQEDSTRLESVYQNPPGYQTWSSTLMHVDADSLLDLVVAFDSEGYFDVAFYPGVKDSFGLRWSGNFAYLSLNFDGGFISKLLPLDIEQNGHQDLLVLEEGTGRVYLKSSPTSGAFFNKDYFRVGPLQFHTLSSAIPFDYGNDGQVDLLAIGHFVTFVGNLSSFQSYQQTSLWGMALWRNTHWFGTPTTFGDVLDFKAQLADINKNGLFDFIASAFPYSFEAFENPNPNFQDNWRLRNDLVAPFVTSGSRRDSIYFDPSFADLDDDGDLDLLISERYFTAPGTYKARYRFFENQLTADTIIWKRRDDWLTGLGEINYSHGNFADIDRDGDADVVFGTHEGGLLSYENIGSTAAPSWRLMSNVFAEIDVGDDASPSFGDFDNNGRIDLFIGNRSGDIFFFRNETIVGVEEKPTDMPRCLYLHQNFPNPFNAGTHISYEIPQAGHVQLIIYDLLGRRVATLVDETQQPGRHQVVWGCEGMASGLYFYELQVGDKKIERRMSILLR